MAVINYIASKTGAKLHKSNRMIRGIMGAVGTGKSVVCLQELFRLSVDQWPNSEGIRKTRWAIIRNTSIELETTTLNTFKQWFPWDICRITLRPYIKANIEIPLPDKTKVEAEFYFLALDRDDDVRKLLSLEITGGFMNEARELSYAVLKALRERTGRYPSRIDGYDDIIDPNGKVIYKAPRGEDGKIQPCKRRSIVIDTNPPDDDHWWYQLAEEGCLRKEDNQTFAKSEVSRLFNFVRCPPPLFLNKEGTYDPNPEAENIEFLPNGYQYYLDMIGGNTKDHINVMVLGNYGTIRDGKPVYPEYNDFIHTADNVTGDKELEICLGWDFGLTPSLIIGQMTKTGQVKLLAELTTEDMHVRQFARDVVKPFLSRYFKGIKIGFSVADPAGNNRGEGEGKASISILNDAYVKDTQFNDTPLDMGFETVAATTNDPTLRLNAVKTFLNKMIVGQPGLIVNSVYCPVIRKGFNGEYKYRKIKSAGREEVYTEKPLKNKYSHPHDAVQYLCLGFIDGYEPGNDNMYDEDEYDYQPKREYW